MMSEQKQKPLSFFWLPVCCGSTWADPQRCPHRLENLGRCEGVAWAERVQGRVVFGGFSGLKKSRSGTEDLGTESLVTAPPLKDELHSQRARPILDVQTNTAE
jgi:hypothetical protein